MQMHTIECTNCGVTYETKHSKSIYCSQKCGAAYRWKLTPKDTDKPRTCPECNSQFFATPQNNQKKTCSDACRRKRNSRNTKEFHLRNPERESLYRERTKEKQLPDSNLIRFRRNNPLAPMACESCGETRVLDLAHKPGKERNGAWRSIGNSKWPEMVWVLCPTCHALHDRMHYSPEELGLKI
jgi:hypothetical protein